MPDVRPHRDAILAKLQAVANLGVYDVEVPETPPMDADGKVHPYSVLYVGAGNLVRSSLAAVHDHLDLPFQVTCAGGDATRCLWAVDKVRGALIDQRLTVTGRSLGVIRQDGDSGPPRRDDDVTPPRHFTAVLFRLVSVPA
jgi:hypothetical protein